MKRKNIIFSIFLWLPTCMFAALEPVKRVEWYGKFLPTYPQGSLVIKENCYVVESLDNKFSCALSDNEVEELHNTISKFLFNSREGELVLFAYTNVVLNQKSPKTCIQIGITSEQKKELHEYLNKKTLE